MRRSRRDVRTAFGSGRCDGTVWSERTGRAAMAGARTQGETAPIGDALRGVNRTCLRDPTQGPKDFDTRPILLPGLRRARSSTPLRPFRSKNLNFRDLSANGV